MKNKNIRYGSTLQNGKAHQQDHHNWSRRSFLKNLGLTGGASLLLGNSSLQALNSSLFNLGGTDNDRVLVLVRLKGGNDGLNTIVPLFDYDFYANNRPTIRIQQNQLIDLTDDFAMPNTMMPLQNMWDNGKMKVVNNVGYPDQNLSHFRSTDIWSSSSDTNVVDTSGWLGRYLEGIYPDYLTNPPERPPAIQIGGIGSLVFNDSDQNSLSVNVGDPEELFEIAQNGRAYDVENLPECFYGEQLGFLRSVANSTYIYAEVIKEAYDASTNVGGYDNFGLSTQLALVARLIKGNLGTKMYMVTMDGYDTHADQSVNHANLMNRLSTSIDAFYKDLDATGHGKEVLCMTFSEFGRRVQQNASGGTDHGSAAPVMLFGESLNGNGIIGDKPDLRNVDSSGNLIFSTDFRSIYATIMEDWLCIDTNTVNQTLGADFDRLALGLSCQPTPVFNTPTIQLHHEARYSSDGQIQIYFSLSENMDIDLQVFNILGQPVAQLYKGRLEAGEHSFPFQSKSSLSAGQYVYRIVANGQAFSRAMIAARR